MTLKETHEPDMPINWPTGHVSVAREPHDAEPRERLRLADVGVSITDPDDDECMVVILGSYRHFLHSTTTRALSDMLLSLPEQAATVTIHGVTHTVNSRAVRSLSQLLQKRLTEWNATAQSYGAPGV